MRIEELTDAIGAIDFRFVEEAEQWRGAKKRLPRFCTLIPLAACLCLAVYGTYGLLSRGGAAEPGEGAGGAKLTAEQAEEADGMKAADNAREGAGQDMGGSARASGSLADSAESAGGQKAETGGTGSAVGQGTDGAAADSVEMDAGGEQTADGGGMQIRVNEVKTFSSTIYDIAAPERVEWFSASELARYYGTVVVPERLPAGLVPKNADEACYAVAYDAKDQVADDNNTLNFSDDNSGRTLDISVRTVEQAGEVISFADAGLEISLVNGREVTIGHYRGRDGEDCFLAIFDVGSVMFTVQSRNLTEAELVGILAGLM